jgi:MoxR-like ATPase
MIQSDQPFWFHGKAERRPAQAHPRSPRAPEPYVAGAELTDAVNVNLAIFLGRPLLLEGEAGSGKSRLAHAVAYELGLPFYTWHVRSTSKAQDGLYTYDALLRLHDVHSGAGRDGAETSQDAGADRRSRQGRHRLPQ